MFTIRDAEAADRESICRVHVASIREGCSSHYSEEQIAAWSGFPRPEAYDLALRTRRMLVACESGEVIAFAQLNTETGELEALYVDPAHARRGAGSRLLQTAEEIIRSCGFNVMPVRATLNAVPFYASRGFERVGELLHRHPSGVALACVDMKKRL